VLDTGRPENHGRPGVEQPVKNDELSLIERPGPVDPPGGLFVPKTPVTGTIPVTPNGPVTPNAPEAPADPVNPFPPARPAKPKGALRGDIQGLRAIAVTMVLIYHAGLTWLPGGFAGVDVFFVISGFLITGLMIREIERSGKLSLRRFWARRAKRLLPATALVLVAVAGLSLLVLPPLRWAGVATDLSTAALYVINWRLAGQSVDYLAQNYAASPLQHFWSLAVEEQFYVAWPLIVLVISTLVRRRGRSLRKALFAAVTLVVAGSLAWSIYLGARPEAYFVTTTRAWELGIGAAVAILAVRLRGMNRHFARILTWVGVLTLIGVAFRLPDTVPWPGWAALLPTLATAAVIAGGPAAGSKGATALIGRAPFRWIGDLSYSLYLWHWPLIVFATVQWTKLSGLQGLAVVAVSFVPAYLTNRLLESPLHRSKVLTRFPSGALALGALCTAIGVAAGFWVNASIPPVKAVPIAQREGAAALGADPSKAVPQLSATSITPDPLVARNDLPDLYARGCMSNYSAPVPVPCEFGDPASTKWVVLVGDSQAAQWATALQVIAGQQGWRLTTITKSGCPFAQAKILKGAPGKELPYTSCTQWNAATMQLLKSAPTKPDLVITSDYSPYVVSVKGKPATGAKSREAMVTGLNQTWKTLNADGIPVVALRETPIMNTDVADCVSQHRDHLDKCSTPQPEALRTAHTIRLAAEGLPKTGVVDLTTSVVCPAAKCPAVIGNVLVYRDEHHLTAEYSRSLSPFLAQSLSKFGHKKFDKGALKDLLPLSVPKTTPGPTTWTSSAKQPFPLGM
jgi:peptidoglycan/LPS O-acetylase OafA/YrhL